MPSLLQQINHRTECIYDSVYFNPSKIITKILQFLISQHYCWTDDAGGQFFVEIQSQLIIVLMQRVSIQRVALNLSSNSYMNSTTKYTKAPANITNDQKQNEILNHQSHLTSLQKVKYIQKDHSVPGNQVMKYQVKRSTSKSSDIKNESEKSAHPLQSAALALSARVFMNSTTKFLKGFQNLALKVNPEGKETKESPLPQRSNRMFSINKREQNRSSSPTKHQKNTINHQSSNNLALSIKPANQTSEDKIVYPSKSKIQKIINNTNTISPMKTQSKLNLTLNRKKIISQRSVRGNSDSKSCSRSGSKSLGRFSRKKQKIRELKFAEKRQNSIQQQQKQLQKKSQRQLQIHPQQQLPKQQQKSPRKQQSSQLSTPIGSKIVNPINQNKLKQTKSADSKIILEPKQAVAKPNKVQKPIKNNEKKVIVTSLILSQLSQPSIKRQGYHINAMLPSGELPLETPIKPKINYQYSKIHPRQDENKPKAKQPTQITIIKQENTSSLNNSKYNKATHQSVKQQASTHIDYHTVVVNAPTNIQNNKNISKFDKNQSTIALGKSQIYGLSTLIRMQQSQLKESARKDNTIVSSIFQPKKPMPKKVENNNKKDGVIQVQPIQNTSSLLSQRSMQKIPIGRNTLRSPQLSQISSKSSETSSNHVNSKKSNQITSKMTIKQPSNIKQTAKQQTLQRKQTEKQPTPKYQIKSLLKNLSILTKITNRLAANNYKSSIHKMKSQSRIQANNNKQGLILASSASNIYHNLYNLNLRTTFQRLKRITLNNPINKKPIQSKDHCKNISSNLIYRVCISKIRQYFSKLKSESLMKDPSEINFKQRQAQIYQLQEHQLRFYHLSQFIKIIRKHPLNILKRCLNKLILSSLKQKHNQQIQSLQNIKIQKQTLHSQQLQQKKSTLLRNGQAIQSQILRLSSKLSEKKRWAKIQKDKLIKKQDLLLKNNNLINTQVTFRTNKNKELQILVNQFEAKQLDLQSPQSQLFLGKLIEIYNFIFKQSSQFINTTQLIQKYPLPKISQNQVLQQWISLSQNIQLKSQLTKWQGQHKLQRSKQVLIGEKDLITKVIQNYIRQRYLWQCIKLATGLL